MANPEPFPRADEEAAKGSNQRPAGRGSRWVVVLLVIGTVALIGLMIALHLTGAFGPGSH